MSISPASAERLAAEVVGHYQDAEQALIERIARNLARGIDAPFWAEQKLAQLQQYERQARALLAEASNRVRGAAATATASCRQGKWTCIKTPFRLGWRREVS